MRLTAAALATVSCLAFSRADAQTSSGTSGGGMTLSSRVSIDYQEANVDSAGKRTDWMQIVVLWRGQPGWQSGAGATSVQRAAGNQVYEQARVAAAVANRGFSGSGGPYPHWTEIDRSNGRLYVLGREFDIPPRGSALIVIVDRVDGIGGPPMVIGSAVIDGTLPEDVRGKTWTSGDTTFMVRPSKSGIQIFLETLRQDPVVGAFLSEGAP